MPRAEVVDLKAGLSYEGVIGRVHIGHLVNERGRYMDSILRTDARAPGKTASEFADSAIQLPNHQECALEEGIDSGDGCSGGEYSITTPTSQVDGNLMR